MSCLSENILRAYHDGEVDAVERPEIEAHLASCAQCGERLREVAATSERVQGQLLALDPSAAEASVDPRVALARFKALHDVDRGAYSDDGTQGESFFARAFGRRWRLVWVTAAAALVIMCGLAFPSGRSLAERFLGTLRIEKVQPVRLDFSALDGNRPLQEMLRQMLSENVVVTKDEKSDDASTAADASQLGGFPVRLVSSRTDAPKFTVEGQHAFHMAVDRARLQDIFDQAGRSDISLPAKLEGATVSVNIPRSVRVEYGDCPHAHKKEGGQAPAGTANTPGTAGTWSNCLALVEAPSPVVNMPADLNIEQLAEIGLQLTGMNATQARELGQSIDWKSTLVLPMPRASSTATQVTVAGTQGTLISGSGRRGPDYVLIWVKNGIIYGLVGHGDGSDAVALANSLS
jgi:hypothetical protein